MRFCAHDNYVVCLAKHIDTDKGNAGNIHNGALCLTVTSLH